MIDYITAKEAAQKWGISHRRVITLCDEKRIVNAAMFGNMWLIPSDTEKPVDGRSLRYEKKVEMKPFLKWAGGKGKLLPTIRSYYPKDLGTKITKYCEPMIGGGAIFFDILNHYEMEEILICDLNRELVNTYRVIQENVETLVELLLKFEEKHLKLNDDRRKEYYFYQREVYNQEIFSHSANDILRAALFVYLNKTCFNGLYRVNKKGQYNVPMGSYKKPCICDAKNLMRISESLSNVKIKCGDYSQVDDFVDAKTFVYFDPPYRPLSKTARFTAYTDVDFGDDEQVRLADFIKSFSDRGAKILASNSDPKNADINDDFFDRIYAPLRINRVTASRSINCDGKNRGKINELLICNY